VVASTSSFTINCSGSPRTFTLSASPATTYTLTPTPALPAGSVCTVTVLSANVTDNDFGYNMAADFTFSFNVPPIANPDTYPQNVIGNVNVNSANIPFSTTTNDISLLAFTITAFDAVTPNGGTVAMTTTGAGMGQFTYNPPAGFTGASDTFTYTISNAGGSATATVTVPVSGAVWFIDRNSALATADGRLTSPFKTIDAFQTINDGTGNHPKAGQTIFVYESAGAYNGGGITLLANQKLVGQDSTSSLATLFGTTPPSGSAPFPAMNSANGTTTTITTTTAGRNAVTLPNSTTSNNVINGLTIGAVTNVGIASNVNFGPLTIADVIMSTGTSQAINLDTGTATTLNATFHSITQSGGAKAIRVNNAGGTFTVTGDNALLAPNGGTISNTTGRGAEFIGPAAKNLAVTLNKMNFTNTVSTAVSPSVAGGTCDFVASNGSNTTCAAAIHLQALTNVNLNTINVTTTKQMGINGFDVTNVNMNTVVVTGAGDEANEMGLNFQNILGTCAWTSVNVHDNGTTGGQASVMNDAGTLTALNISGSTFSRLTNGGGNSFAFVGQKFAAMNLNVQSSTFRNSSATAMMIHMNENSSLGSVGTPAVVNNCTFQGNNNHIDAAWLNGTMFVDITNNGTATPMIGANTGAAINVFGGRPGTGSATVNVTGNVVGQTGVASSGCSGACSGIQINASGGTTITASVNNNTIRNVTGWGIYAEAFDHNTAPVASPKMFVNIAGNTIAEPGPFVNEAILVQAGAVAGDAATTCANINNNTVGGAWTGGFLAANIAVWNRFAGGAMRIAGWNSATQTVPQYLASQNPTGGTTASANSGAISGGAPNTCP
jgi:trimeric autotransporter adhesin